MTLHHSSVCSLDNYQSIDHGKTPTCTIMKENSKLLTPEEKYFHESTIPFILLDRGDQNIFFFLRRDTFFPMNSWKFLADLLHIRQCAKFLLALTWHIQTLEHNFQLSTAVKEGRMLVVVLSIVCC